MFRRGSTPWYRFDANFFRRLNQLMPQSMSIFTVRNSDGVALSVELMLESDRRLYSFLGGTTEDGYRVGLRMTC